MKELLEFIESQPSLEIMSEENLIYVAWRFCQHLEEAGMQSSLFQYLFSMLYDILIDPMVRFELRDLLSKEPGFLWEKHFAQLVMIGHLHAKIKNGTSTFDYYNLPVQKLFILLSVLDSNLFNDTTSEETVRRKQFSYGRNNQTNLFPGPIPEKLSQKIERINQLQSEHPLLALFLKKLLYAIIVKTESENLSIQYFHHMKRP